MEISIIQMRLSLWAFIRVPNNYRGGYDEYWRRVNKEGAKYYTRISKKKVDVTSEVSRYLSRDHIMAQEMEEFRQWKKEYRK